MTGPGGCLRSGFEPSGRAARVEPQRAGRPDEGAALVELAMVLPLVVMLIVGMVSAGVAYNHQLSLTHAAREGARYAATLPVDNFGSIDAWLSDVIDHTATEATGSLDPGSPGRWICVAYVHPDASATSPQTTRRIMDGASLLPAEADEDCLGPLMSIDDGRPTSERRVQIIVEREAEFNALVFGTTITLDSEAVNRFEAALGS